MQRPLIPSRDLALFFKGFWSLDYFLCSTIIKHMTQATVIKKVLGLEAEIKTLKRKIEKEPDFDIDEVNWRKVKQEAKKIRTRLYQSRYGKR